MQKQQKPRGVRDTEHGETLKTETSRLKHHEDRATDESSTTLKEMIKKLKKIKSRHEEKIKEQALRKQRKSMIEAGLTLTLDTSKDSSFSLPKIQGASGRSESTKQQMKFLYGFGTSEFQSSSTLRNSIHSISFPKSERFQYKEDPKPRPPFSKLVSKSQVLQNDAGKGHSLHRLLKGATMGGANRVGPISPLKLKEEAKLPGPGQYHLELVRESLTSRHSRKIELPLFEGKFRTSIFDKPIGESPGPARYELRSEIAKMSERKKLFNRIKQRLESEKLPAQDEQI